MAKKKSKKNVSKETSVSELEGILIAGQDLYAENPKLPISQEAIAIKDCAVGIAVSGVSVAEPFTDIAVDEKPLKVTMPEHLADEVTVTETFCTVGVGNILEEPSMASDSLPSQPRASPYTQPPVRLLIGSEETIHYVPRHLLPDNFVHNDSVEQLSLRGMDIGTGHTFIHYFHTGLYETIDTYGDSTKPKSGVKLRHALSVYLSSINHDLPCLNSLAVSEMMTHASRMDLVEVLGAIGNDFQKLGPKSWVHEHLRQRSKAAFEDNHDVFTSQAFLDALRNSKLTKFIMECMAECYQAKISRMNSREREMSEVLNDHQNDVRASSKEKVVLGQDNAVQHELVTPLASESTISERCEIETTCDDDEDFCTISCPPSEYSNELQECSEEATQCSSKSREHYQHAEETISYDTDSAGPMSSEQLDRSICLTPLPSIEATHDPTREATAQQCSSNLPIASHHGLGIQTPEDNVTTQTIMDENDEEWLKAKEEKKKIKKQRKLLKRREQKEMKELWEAVRRLRSDLDQGGDQNAEAEVHTNFPSNVQEDPVRSASTGVQRISGLEAAIALILRGA